jgi:hypothetical protein
VQVVAMKVASRSGFFVFLGGILAARNVVHVRAAFTLSPPPIPDMSLDQNLSVFDLHVTAQSNTITPWTVPLSLQTIELMNSVDMHWN